MAVFWSRVGAGWRRPIQGNLKNVPIELAAAHASDGFGGPLGRGKAQPGAASPISGPPVHGKIHLLNIAVPSKNFAQMGRRHIPRQAFNADSVGQGRGRGHVRGGGRVRARPRAVAAAAAVAAGTETGTRGRVGSGRSGTAAGARPRYRGGKSAKTTMMISGAAICEWARLATRKSVRPSGRASATFPSAYPSIRSVRPVTCRRR